MLDAPAALICAQEHRLLRYFVPVFSSVFIIATLLNLIPVGLMSADQGPMLVGSVPLELAIFGMLHLVFITRIFRARRFAAGQRARDLELFKGSRSRP